MATASCRRILPHGRAVGLGFGRAVGLGFGLAVGPGFGRYFFWMILKAEKAESYGKESFQLHRPGFKPLPSNEVEIYQLPDSVMAIHGGQNAPSQP